MTAFYEFLRGLPPNIPLIIALALAGFILLVGLRICRRGGLTVHTPMLDISVRSQVVPEEKSTDGFNTDKPGSAEPLSQASMKISEKIALLQKSKQEANLPQKTTDPK